MNDVTPNRDADMSPDLATLTTAQLKHHLAHQMELSAHHLVKMASIWTELERRGEDLSALRTSLTDYLPQIASGDLDAQAVVQFAGNRQLLRYLATLPVERQHALLEDGSITLVLPHSREATPRKLAHLSGQEVTQVFGHGIVRSPDEQQRLLDSKASVSKAAKAGGSKTKPAARLCRGTLEVEGKRVKAGGEPLTAERMLDMLSRHYGVDLSSAVDGRGER